MVKAYLSFSATVHFLPIHRKHTPRNLLHKGAEFVFWMDADSLSLWRKLYDSFSLLYYDVLCKFGPRKEFGKG